MAVDPDKAIVLYPAYFELRVSRGEGRMVAKKHAVEGASAQMIYEAVKTLGLDCILELDKSYPRFWYRSDGRVLVEPKLKKHDLLEKVASQLRSLPKPKPE
jgi:signal recognition particle subunit SRP19